MSQVTAFYPDLRIEAQLHEDAGLFWVTLMCVETAKPIARTRPELTPELALSAVDRRDFQGVPLNAPTVAPSIS